MTAHDVFVFCTLAIAYVFTGGLLYVLPPLEPHWPSDGDRLGACTLWPLVAVFMLGIAAATLGARTGRAMTSYARQRRTSRAVPHAREVRRGGVRTP